MLTRRSFLTSTAAGIAGLACFGPFAAAASAAERFPRRGRRVVVVGGGFAGATAAHYLKLYDPGLEVILLEPRQRYVTCPSSNLVIGGLRSIKELTHGYEHLQKGLGVRVVHEMVRGVDPVGHYVLTARGRIGYDRLVVAPGIDFIYEQLAGMDQQALRRFPHGYQAGPQTLQLARGLASLRPGGSYLITIPEAPYRCPPGPYERICMVAAYLKRTGNRGKVLVLDANDDVVSKGKLFKAAWNELYPGMIEYHPEVVIKAVSAGRRSVTTNKGELSADLLNIIPAQRAGKLAAEAGLISKGGRWAPVNPLTFESALLRDIHVIGDAADRGTTGSLPHSGFVSNAMGKAAAVAVIALLQGKEPPAPSLQNACYSQVSDTESIYVTGVFAFDPVTGKLAGVKGAGGTSPDRSARYTEQYRDWQASIVKDTFGG